MQKGSSPELKYWLALLLCLLVAGWLVSGQTSAPDAVRRDTLTVNEKPSQGFSLNKGSERKTVKPSNARELLAEFTLTGNQSLLLKAQRLFPADPDVILVSCLEAKSPDSVYLLMMEMIEPDNALPHLMRAGMYAEKNEQLLAQELERAVAKAEIFTDLYDRQASVVEAVKSKGASGIAAGQISILDVNYYNCISGVYCALASNPLLFGDPVSTANVGMDLVRKFRQSAEKEYSYDMLANQLELEMLRSLPELRLEFFTRMSEEGELATVDWLMKL